MSAWEPAKYLRFSNERFAPFEDLLALVHVRPGMHAIDLGCGSGELTARLAAHLPDSNIVGIDASEEMLRRARARERSGLHFAFGPIENQDGRWDLILSNAALHWVDDHPALMTRLFGMLQPGGQLVAQVPARRRPDAYATIVEVAQEAPFAAALGGKSQPWPVLRIEDYARIFHELGAEGITAFEKVYVHELADADAVVDWQSSSVLLWYRDRLNDAQYAAFERVLRERLRARWPHGPIVFPFRRTLLAATRPA